MSILIFKIKGEEQVKTATKSSTPKSQASASSGSTSKVVGHDASGFSMSENVHDFKQKTESFISQVQHKIVRMQHASGRVVEEEVWSVKPDEEQPGPSGPQKATSAESDSKPKSVINKSDYGSGSPPSAKRQFTTPAKLIPFSAENQASTRFPVGDSVSLKNIL